MAQLPDRPGATTASDWVLTQQSGTPGSRPASPDIPYHAPAVPASNHSAAASQPRTHSLSISSHHSRPKTAELAGESDDPDLGVGLTRETRDPDVDIGLPYRTLSNDADMTEYRTETAAGEIEGPPVAGSQGHYHLTTFKPNDPENPKNWSTARKWYCTIVVAATCFAVTFSSSNVSADFVGVREEFGVSQELALATMSLFVVGLGVGPMAFAPLSEIYGRWIIYATTLGLAVVFIIPCAVAKNIETLLICRFIDGVMFSAPMTLVGGTLADIWRLEERGVPMSAFSAAPFLGPAVGPLTGGFLSDATNWRWLYWIQVIVGGVMWMLITFTVPETYAPTILARRAAKLRKETGKSYVTEYDLDMRPLAERLRIFLLRPFQLLFMELIVFLISLYMSILYGVLYMFFVAYPIVYQEGKGYTSSETGLMFIPLAVGVTASGLCSPYVNRHFLYISRKHDGRPPPEARLYPMMASCWLMPIGLFIFAWTSYPHLSWVGPCLAGFPVGFGFIFLYNAANNYLVDCYQHQAASALAAKVCLRAFWGAAVVLFTEQMYHRLGYQWASSLVAFISLACCAIPFGFFYYGARIREWSKYAYAGDEEDKVATSHRSSDIEKQGEGEGEGVGTAGGVLPAR